MVEAVLLDIGNVLVHFDFSRAFARLAPRAGNRLAEAERLIREMGTGLETGRLSTQEFMAQALAALGPAVTADEFRTAFCDIFRPNNAMWDVQRRLQAKVPVYHFSNTSELHETWLMAHYPVFRECHGGFYSWRTGSMKPHEAFYRAAVTALALPAERIAYVDDNAENIATADRLGMPTHLYSADRHDDVEAFFARHGL